MPKLNEVDFYQQIRTIMDKSKCFNIFQKTKVNGMKLYSQERTIKDIIHYSIEIKSKEKELKNI